MVAAVRTEALTKQFALGQRGYRTLRESLSRGLRRERADAGASHAVVTALRELDLDIEEGETVGFIGHNGAGKSTLLKVLSRITEPTSGRAQVRGRVGSLLEVGTGFHPELTGRENVYLNGAVLGMSRREIARRFDEIVDFADVERFLDTPVKRYSSGMYVRLAFSVAAHLEPEVLIVDEVLAVGDAAFQRRSVGRMSEVARDGRTVLFVSHNMAVVQALCRRAVVMQAGRKIADGPVDAAVTQYLRGLEQVAAADLAGRTDRGGRGAVRATAVTVRAPRHGVARPGEPLEIAVQVDHLVRETTCSLVLHNTLGAPVLALDSGQRSPEDEVTPPSPGDPVVFTACIDPLPLVPGRYRVDVVLSGDGHVQDALPAAGYVDVEQGVLAGRPVVGGPGDVAAAHRWLLPDSAAVGGEQWR